MKARGGTYGYETANNVVVFFAGIPSISIYWNVTVFTYGCVDNENKCLLLWWIYLFFFFFFCNSEFRKPEPFSLRIRSDAGICFDLSRLNCVWYFCNLVEYLIDFFPLFLSGTHARAWISSLQSFDICKFFRDSAVRISRIAKITWNFRLFLKKKKTKCDLAITRLTAACELFTRFTFFRSVDLTTTCILRKLFIFSLPFPL